MNRDSSIDTLRGFAIVCMFLSNLAGEILQLPHPFLLRVVGSLAAPIFILLAGYMLGIGILTKKHSSIHFFVRGLFLMLIGALIDIFSWRVLPFFWFDVLYLIGLSTMLLSFLKNVSLFYSIAFSIVSILLAPILQNVFGYNQIEYFEWENFKELFGYFLSLDASTFFKQWLINGWFPIFPWLGVFVLGFGISEKRNLSETIFSEKLIIVMGFLFFTGVSFWSYEPKLDHRGGYSEFFYPPTISYFLVFLSLSCFVYILIEQKLNKIEFLMMFGESPLFFYLTHLAIIALIKNFLPKDLGKVSFFPFLFLFCLGIGALGMLGWILRKTKLYTQKLPFPINLIFH